eukprot:TRINITY_DN35065_c0_g1_i1.p1 TRINITY_DN35065_c0_g1~~TRINITY_DN35065_c0_g1_i1.p1  ORF type:complete len:423 (-),score=71.26 TRINITY_DN35065_c0_g1_i1:261-1469(-)
MGAFFSLHETNEWAQNVKDMEPPSIWSHASFSPLSRETKVLMDKASDVSYVFPHGLRHGNDFIQLCAASEVSLLVCFNETNGRIYAGTVLKAVDGSPHLYRRAKDQAAQFMGTRDTTRLQGQGVGGEPVDERGQGEDGEATKPSTWRLDMVKENLERMRQGTRRSTPEPAEPLELEKLFQEVPSEDSHWPYALLYRVKEGVLVYFAESHQHCEEAVRQIAVTYAIPPLPPAQDSRAPSSLGRTSQTRMMDSSMVHTREIDAESFAIASRNAESEVKVVEHLVGRAPALVTRAIADCISADLTRRFALSCEPEDHADCTNCVVFCMRIILDFSLSLRGFDIECVCQENKLLGEKAGAAVNVAWETLWLQSGGLKERPAEGESRKGQETQWAEWYKTAKPTSAS